VLPDSNATLLRDSHKEKQLGQRIVTADGMHIDFSGKHRPKADSLMHWSFEPDSNRRSEIELQKKVSAKIRNR
jgi:hypothetical protein